MKEIFTPITKEKIAELRVGDTLFLTGTIFTARDAAHECMLDHLEKTGEMLLKGETVYYAGPCPAKPGEPIGSVGPTSSCRMDPFVKRFTDEGIIATIGKGSRSEEARSAIVNAGGAYFEAIGGAGAYYKQCVKKAELVYFPELGAEAVYKLEVEKFPVILAVAANS